MNIPGSKKLILFYIESPGDVGFSYINSTDEEDLRTDDNTTARDNLNALLSFFEKFPELREKDFYITGGSYAGIYVPILAYRVLEYNEKAEDIYYKPRGRCKSGSGGGNAVHRLL